MAEVLFNNVIMVAFIFFLQLEAFYFVCYSPVINLSKAIKITKTGSTRTFLNSVTSNGYYFLLFFLFLFFFKTPSSNVITLLVLAVIFLSKVDLALSKFNTSVQSNNIIQFITPTFVSFFFLLFFIKSFLTFFFFIELYGVLYYFCFLTSYNFTSQTILKYKNGLLMLLWNNFLTTFFLGLGCFFMLKNSGSTSFTELQFLQVDKTAVMFFLIGLFWKLGLPLFHFFKLEVYKYLLKENVFLFSILTTLMNVILFYFCFTQPSIFSIIYEYNILLLVVIFAITLLIINLKLTNLLQFFALSGVFTLSTVLVVFLI